MEISKRYKSAINAMAHNMAQELELVVQKRLMRDAMALPDGADFDQWLSSQQLPALAYEKDDLPL